MGDCGAAGNEAGIGERDRAEAQSGDRGAAIVRADEDRAQILVERGGGLGPGRNDHQIGGGGHLRAVEATDAVALGGSDLAARRGPQHGRPARRQAQSPHLAEHELRHGEVKHRDSVEGIHRDAHATSLA